ncbi:YfcE family phosphodiesterase [archaeon]|nr:YfcE family phosphodiesterase [archaeon]
MIRILAIGDTHIPSRARKIPDLLQVWLTRHAPFDIVACTGDLTEEPVLRSLRSFGKTFYVVEGNMDWLPLPSQAVFEVEEDLRIGLIHGHQVFPRGNRQQLLTLARRMDVQLLISGHTHQDFCELHNYTLLLNPGSATGVWGGGGGSLIPSCAVLEVVEGHLLVRILQVRKGSLFEKLFRFSFKDLLP